MKKKRAQARKRGVEIPPSPELAEHADRIRALGRQTFDGVIEIGERLVRCRELLKTQRLWLAWLEAEFRWSRRTADRFIAVFRAKGKLGKLRTLGVGLSGLYLLAKASPEVVEGIEHRAKTGHRIHLAEIEQRTRAKRKRADPEPAAIQITSPADNGTRPTFGSMALPPEPASEQRKPLTAEDLQAAVRRDLVNLIIDVARFRLPRDPSLEEARAVVESIDAEGMRERFSEAVAKLYEFVGQLQRALNERLTGPAAPTLSVIPGKDDQLDENAAEMQK